MKHPANFDKLLNPASLAMIGASKSKYKTSGRFLKAFIDDGYKGDLYPVNPKEKQIHKLKSYPSVLDIPGPVDLAYIAVPSTAVPGVIAECSEKGVEFAIVHSAGFSEIGDEGKELEKKMLEAVSNGKPRILGPNCMGIYAPAAGINTVTLKILEEDINGPVAFIAQSGWVPHNTVQMGRVYGIRFNSAFSIGNQADITLEDFLEYFGNDRKTKVVSFYIEGLKNGRRFMDLAKKVSKKKPILVWKGGRSAIGTRAVASHTGSLAGNNTIFHAAMKQCGVTVVHDLDEMVDMMAAFTCPYLPKGNKVGFLVESGGGGVAGADSSAEYGLDVATLSPERQKELFDRLQGVVPPFSMPKNPVDLVWPPDVDRFKLLTDCAEIILKEVDSLVIIDYATYNFNKDHDDYVKAMLGLRDKVKKPIFLAPCFPVNKQKELEKQNLVGLPSYSIPERAVRALSALCKYADYQRSV